MPTAKTPDFWYQPRGLTSALLWPAAQLYRLGNYIDRKNAKPEKVDIPVIAVGNAVAGGAGKTPATIAIVKLLQSMGQNPHIVSRGYGRKEDALLQVDETQHSAADVGDEPLLLARYAPCWVNANRYEAAFAAKQAGASVIVMDDGLQHTKLQRDMMILCVSGKDGFGNGQLIPAGPLRQPLESLLPHVHATLVIGERSERTRAQLKGLTPCYGAALEPRNWKLAEKKVVAFAAIARPERFFTMLETEGATIISRHAYGDHYSFTDKELAAMAEEAARNEALLVTTEKDFARLPTEWQERVTPLPIDLVLAERDALGDQLQELLSLYYTGA